MDYNLGLKQIQILDFIKSQILSKGYSPSLREICEGVGLKSTSSVHSHLKKLERLGFIKRYPEKPRAITIIDKSYMDSLNFNDYIVNKNNLHLLPKIPRSEAIQNFKSLLPDSPHIGVFENQGNAMTNSKIFDNDYVVVDSSIHNYEGKIVLAVVNNEFSTIRKFNTQDDMIRLDSDNDSGECIFTKRENVEVIGTVIGSFRNIEI